MGQTYSFCSILLGMLNERPSEIDELIMLRNKYLRSQDEGWTNNWQYNQHRSVKEIYKRYIRETWHTDSLALEKQLNANGTRNSLDNPAPEQVEERVSSAVAREKKESVSGKRPTRKEKSHEENNRVPQGEKKRKIGGHCRPVRDTQSYSSGWNLKKDLCRDSQLTNR